MAYFSLLAFQLMKYSDAVLIYFAANLPVFEYRFGKINDDFITKYGIFSSCEQVVTCGRSQADAVVLKTISMS